MQNMAGGCNDKMLVRRVVVNFSLVCLVCMCRWVIILIDTLAVVNSDKRWVVYIK